MSSSNRSYAALDLDALEQREGMRVEGVADAILLLTRTELDALIATARMGKAFYAVGLEYGLKHKPFCSMAESEEGSEACDCLLVEKVMTALKGK